MLIMVLNDGDTFSPVDGCKIIEVNDEIDGDDLDEAVGEVYGGETDYGRIVATLRERNARAILGVREGDRVEWEA